MLMFYAVVDNGESKKVGNHSLSLLISKVHHMSLLKQHLKIHTYIYNSTRVQVGTQNQARRGWRAETSQRSAGVRQDSGAGYTPTAWSPSCGAHRWGNHHGWPWKGCSAPCDCEAGASRSTDSTRPDSHWCSQPPYIHPARTCKGDSEH